MKKSLFVIMLVVLCLSSFVACKQDKSGQMVDNYVAFKKIEDLSDYLGDAFASDIKGIKEEGVSITSVQYRDAVTVAEILLTLEDGHQLQYSGTNSTATGKIKGTSTYNSMWLTQYDVTFEDVELTVYYQEIDENDENVGEATSKKFTINGSISHEEKDEDGDINADEESYSCNLTINGVKYDCSYSYYTDSDYNVVYTAAKINGNDVNLDMLNSYTNIEF